MITPIIPLLLVLVPASYIASNSPERILESNPLIFIMTFGLIGSKITNKLIVSLTQKLRYTNSNDETKAPFPLYDKELQSILSLNFSCR